MKCWFRNFAIGLSIVLAGGFIIGACQTGVTTPTTGNLNVKLKANFGKDVLSKGKLDAAKLSSCPNPAPTDDGPDLVAGLDCDSDGGVLQYITPSKYKMAIKRLSLVAADGTKVDIVADTGTLANAQVADLTSVFTFDPSSIAPANYPGYEAEIYYVELVMPLYDANSPQTIRIYLSDDDFPAEGNRGHHQGDVAVIDDQGQELGLFTPGLKWEAGSLQAASTNAQRPGSTDSETGHQRGQFGDVNLWTEARFVQGPNQDIFILREGLGLTPTGTGNTVTFSFNVKDCWMYEDFDNNLLFNPCDNPNPNLADACHAGAGWAPLFAKPEVVVE